MAKQSMASIETPDDICNWVYVNSFDFEFDGDEYDDDDSIYDLVESVDSLSSSSSEEEDDVGDAKEGSTDGGVIAHGGDDDVKCSRVSDLGQNQGCDDVDLSNCGGNHGENDGFFEFYNGSNLNLHGQVYNYDGHQHDVDDGHDDDDGDDDHDDDGYGIDDELVPWEVKDRFMRQRIRKSGKNSFGKMAKSKKSALIFTRPGCVRGKHGLGLKVY